MEQVKLNEMVEMHREAIELEKLIEQKRLDLNKVPEVIEFYKLKRILKILKNKIAEGEKRVFNAGLKK